VRVQRKAFKLFADYHQFYLWDRGKNPEAPTTYTKEDTRRRIKTGTHVVVIQTARNTTVLVEIGIHDAEPPFDTSAWDHIAEASLHLPTGQLQVHESTGGPVAEFKLKPGWYRVRAFHAGLGTIDETGMEGRDRYLAVLWPAPSAEVSVIKEWTALPRE
jgi:hypothetical protein